MIALRSGDLEARFEPDAGLVGCSLLHRGEELLGMRNGLAAYRERGSTFGIPLLHPWANRLEGSYTALGKTVAIDERTPRVRREEHGLASHGLVHAWPWRVIEHDDARLTAELEYQAPELLAGFPFPHTLRAEITLHDARLAYTTTLTARDEPVPVAFGYHPYFAPPAAPRAQWHLELPAAERVLTDDRLLPTGEREPFPGFTGPLGERMFDDGFAALPDGTTYAVTASDRRVAVTLEHGYRFAQVFAPAEFDVVCMEPMTAPANALASGEFALAEPGRPYTARFTIEVG